MTRNLRLASAFAVANLLPAPGADGAPRLEHLTLRIAGGIVEIFLDPASARCSIAERWRHRAGRA